MSTRITLIDLDEVCLSISDRILIQNFKLRLESGRRIGLTGPSGCGKTTLLRSIIGRKLTSGSSAAQFKLADCQIGYVPQQGGLLPWFSLRRNLNVFAAINVEDKEKWCTDILALVELTQVGTTFPERLSGGEIQRARLACAIAARPTLCCADEPLTEVGLQQKWRVLERWSSEMSERQTSLILVSHDIDALIYLCDEIIALGGPTGQPVRTVARFVVSAEHHPRKLDDLNDSSFESIRREMVNTLYLEKTVE